ncbi:MAG TPA: PmoA family protein [Verrucomicrobiae bacterium]|jgi:hypothetical protein
MKSLACVTVVLCAARAFAASITVEAGDYDRRDCVVECNLPPGVSGLVADGGKGDAVAVQHEANGPAWFIARDVPRGTKKTYRFAKMDSPNVVEARTGAGTVTLRAFDKTAFVYRTEQTELPPGRPDLKPIYQRGGYLHPVLSPGGKQVTDDYPVNHKHHHGIWFAWTHTEFEGRTPDFWNMGDGKGFVEFKSLDQTWSGPVHAGFVSQHRQMDTTLKGEKPKTALLERWVVKLYAMGSQTKQTYFVFDMEITDTCAHGPVKLPQYRYGGIGVRGNWAWNGKDKLNFLNSEGVTDRSKGDEGQTVGRWAHMGGMVDGGLTGIAVLGHPDNVRAPQPQRIHPTEPFLNLAPQQAGEVEITPEQPLTLRYRFVVADGAPDKAELERLWNDYAHPPIVRVTDK